MAEIIEHVDPGSEGVVRVGQGQTPVSLKVYQDIYHQVTGKTEQIRKRYTENILADFADLEQLHHKVMQLCGVHHVIVSNETISVFHEKERKEVFTSFKRFQAYNGNTASPTINVLLKYNFSIIPAGLTRPQEYVVSIRLTSRVAAIKQMEQDAPPFMRGRFFGYLVGSVAEVTVDYADYVIARGYIEAFDEWMDGCKKTKNSKLLDFLRQYSHRIPQIAQLAVVAIIMIFALQAIPTLFRVGAPASEMARFFVVLSGGAYILITLVKISAELIEHAIDTYPVLSYLRLNKGDERIIEEASSAKPQALFRFVLGCLLSIFLGVLSSRLDKLM